MSVQKLDENKYRIDVSLGYHAGKQKRHQVIFNGTEQEAMLYEQSLRCELVKKATSSESVTTLKEKIGQFETDLLILKRLTEAIKNILFLNETNLSQKFLCKNDYNSLRSKIFARDNNTCQECGEKDKELHVHHIDYNQQNNLPFNLITLCINCHARTNYWQEHWTIYLQAKTFLSERFEELRKGRTR